MKQYMLAMCDTVDPDNDCHDSAKDPVMVYRIGSSVQIVISDPVMV